MLGSVCSRTCANQHPPETTHKVLQATSLFHLWAEHSSQDMPMRLIVPWPSQECFAALQAPESYA